MQNETTHTPYHAVTGTEQIDLEQAGFTHARIGEIVKAVNAFEAMKVALEAVKRGHEPYEGYIMTMVNQAIAKAEGGK